MSNVEDEELVNSSPLYKDRADWKDVSPIYMSDAENAVVRISHTDSFTDAFAYFRAILHRNEMSERALELTTICSQLNPANYSVWYVDLDSLDVRMFRQFRRNILKALNKNLDAEFKFSSEMISENPKNYQIWHHRRMLVDWTKDPSRELTFTASVLVSDPKNYHAWQHRQFIVEKYNLFTDDEISYSTLLLSGDIRNNSVWNYRYFIVQNMSNAFTDKSFVSREVEFAKNAISKVSCNESSWSYLNGLLVNDGLEKHEDVLEFCKVLHKIDTTSTHLRCFLLDYYKEQIEKANESEKNGALALSLIDELVQMDPVRRAYYDYVRDHVNNLLSRQ
ncbi:hypothetical protein M3Y98_00232800 [Aphelenchoides besseyi]|nr:hypothetical protein M3Y98_00232800 [Aphelenchoides besseyi]KAI6200604.1 hypothetical protein M3Y96_00751600 [Aphelenchoides besseyi]